MRVGNNEAMLRTNAATSREGVTQVISLGTSRIFDISLWFRLQQTSNLGFQLSAKIEKKIYIYFNPRMMF